MRSMQSTLSGEGDPMGWMRWRTRVHDDRTDDVLAESARTRHDLHRLTQDLAEYTADLRARLPLLEWRREDEGGPQSGGA